MERKNMKSAEQLLIVEATGRTTALVSLLVREESSGFRQLVKTTGYIGKNGMGKSREGDGKTPVGVFRFTFAFGIADDPGCAIPYHKVGAGDYWSGDYRDGYHYNKMVSVENLPDLDTTKSEHLLDYIREYRYCLNISYNSEGIPGKGSAIFLHCESPYKKYTEGCVAIPEEKMLSVMKHVRENCVVLIVREKFFIF